MVIPHPPAPSATSRSRPNRAFKRTRAGRKNRDSTRASARRRLTSFIRHPVASIEHIFVAAAKGEPVQSVNAVEALSEQGLRGDRYALAPNRAAPDYQVTLIEIENIEAFAQTACLPLTPGMPRRNIVTRGVRLNELCGNCFRVGVATFEGLELCEPCAIFAKVTYQEALKFFVRKGGLRARIIGGGEIRVGDFVGEDA